MGFWSELFNATPGKGIARAEELKFKVVTHVIPVPPGLEDRAKICSLCRIHIGDKFTRNLLPYLVVTEDSNLTFDSSAVSTVISRKKFVNEDETGQSFQTRRFASEMSTLPKMLTETPLLFSCDRTSISGRYFINISFGGNL